MEVYLAIWKNQVNHTEVFNNLQVFIQSYPRYNFPQFEDSFTFSKTVYEDKDVRVEKKTVVDFAKPDFPRVFFWDFNYDRIDWKDSCVTVIQRVLERGSAATHWKELERYYGRETIIYALKEKITFMFDEVIDEASLYFKIQKEDMLCYKRKQSQKIPWP